MFGRILVKKEDLDSLNMQLSLEKNAKEAWQKEHGKAMSDYARCRSEKTKADVTIKALEQELEQVKNEKEALEKQVHDYLTAESLWGCKQ